MRPHSFTRSRLEKNLATPLESFVGVPWPPCKQSLFSLLPKWRSGGNEITTLPIFAKFSKNKWKRMHYLLWLRHPLTQSDITIFIHLLLFSLTENLQTWNPYFKTGHMQLRTPVKCSPVKSFKKQKFSACMLTPTEGGASLDPDGAFSHLPQISWSFWRPSHL